MGDLYTENLESFKKEIEYFIGCKTSHSHILAEYYKMSVIENNLQIQLKPFKVPMRSAPTRKTILKFVWRHKRPQITIAIHIFLGNAKITLLHEHKLCYRAIGVRDSVMLAQKQIYMPVE